MGIINQVKEGADLTHPKPTIGYIVGAAVAVVVIMVVIWIVKKGKSVIAPTVTNITGLETQASQQLTGFL